MDRDLADSVSVIFDGYLYGDRSMIEKITAQSSSSSTNACMYVCMYVYIYKYVNLNVEGVDRLSKLLG
jgi:hypothetical protein